jgi:hypothetical protein
MNRIRGQNSLTGASQNSNGVVLFSTLARSSTVSPSPQARRFAPAAPAFLLVLAPAEQLPRSAWHRLMEPGSRDPDLEHGVCRHVPWLGLNEYPAPRGRRHPDLGHEAMRPDLPASSRGLAPRVHLPQQAVGQGGYFFPPPEQQAGLVPSALQGPQ